MRHARPFPQVLENGINFVLCKVYFKPIANVFIYISIRFVRTTCVRKHLLEQLWRLSPMIGHLKAGNPEMLVAWLNSTSKAPKS